MKIGIDTFGCDHARSGLGSYLYYFVSNLPTDSEISFELFGSEMDRYTYTSGKDISYTSVNVPDSLQAERFWHYLKINKFIKKNNYDVTLFPAIENVFPTKTKGKSVAIVNSILSNFLAKTDKFTQFQLKRGLNNVNKIVAASNFIKNDLILNGISASKIQVIYNGIDHKMFFPAIDLNPDVVEIKPFAIKRPYFIYGSRLSGPEKKHIELIQAFTLFKKKSNYPHRLVICGSDGPYSTEIQKAVLESEFASDIFVTGYFPHESFPKLYAGATACVFPSVNEGVGLPILESMACGIPVLCSTSGALPEIGGDVPLYFDSNNVDQIAAQMQKIVDDKELYKQKSEAGLLWASRFNWEKTVEQTINFINNDKK
jgi:glycosyltransferase involved in cell wall biosynthesis